MILSPQSQFPGTPDENPQYLHFSKHQSSPTNIAGDATVQEISASIRHNTAFVLYYLYAFYMHGSFQLIGSRAEDWHS